MIDWFVFLAPVLLLAVLALLVRWDSQGAPLFRQTRVGKQGREFTVYKLRTMRAEAERELQEADAAIVTSYCPEGAGVSRMVLESAAA